jgi:hypothetical protein
MSATNNSASPKSTDSPVASDYNVYRNKAQKTCVSYFGGGSPTPPAAYEHKFGPDTLAACNKWIEDNCKDGGGTQCS